MLSSTLSPILERMAVSRPRCLSCSCQASMAGFCVVHMRASHGFSSSTTSGPRSRAGVAQELLPEGDAGELAFVVGMAVGPVEALEAVRGKPVMRSRAACASGPADRSAPFHSRRQPRADPMFLPWHARVWLKRTSVPIVHDGYCEPVETCRELLTGWELCAFRRERTGITEESELARAHRLRVEAGLPIADLTASNPTRCGFAIRF